MDTRTARRLLIIEGSTANPECRVSAALANDERWACRRIEWPDVIACADLHAADAIVAVAERSSDAMSGVLEAFAQRLLPRPLLAVVPPDLEGALLDRLTKLADAVVFAPVRHLELVHRLTAILEGPPKELDRIRERIQQELGLSNLVGRDPAFVHAIEPIPRYARTDLSVLITGETGTGKELCARALHHLSRRRECPFVAVDCGAVPDQLFESELFGHRKGAFTDAHRDRRGVVALADGGTLFLDEIDALSLTSQAKLLRLIQERTFRPLGSERVETANVRVVVATNRDLEASVANRQFRSDLFFRLNVLRLHLPPLRERRDDVELLALSALKDCAAVLERPPRSLSPAAIRLLCAYDWPGNVRELVNVVQRAAVGCTGDQLLPIHFTLPGTAGDAGTTTDGSFRRERAAVVAAFERRYVEDMLRKHDGNVTHAAREARQNRRVFGRFIKKYKIDRRVLKA